MGIRLSLLSKGAAALLSGGFALMLQSKPDDVVENVRAWLALFGMDQPPAWVRSEAFVAYARPASVLLLAGVAAWLLWPLASRLSRRGGRAAQVVATHAPKAADPLGPPTNATASEGQEARLSATAQRAPEPKCGKLYEGPDEGRRVRLRFLPDTEQQEGDTLLLVVFGHKALRGEDASAWAWPTPKSIGPWLKRRTAPSRKRCGSCIR